MRWQFSFSDRAKAEFKLLNKVTQKRIQNKILDIIDNVNNAKANPTHFFKPLTGTLVKLYSLRIGDYRLICKINNGQHVIIAIHMGHRSKVYD